MAEPETVLREADLREGLPAWSWLSVIGGLAIGFFVYFLLGALGVGIGGISLSSGIENYSAAGVAIGLWTVLSITLALFGGAYFAARISGFRTSRVAAAEGLLIASLFFALLLAQFGFAAAWLGRGIASTAAAMTNVTRVAPDSPQIHDLIENSLGNLNLKSPPDKVVAGIASRLWRNDTDGAISYLAAQSNLNEQQVRTQISNLREKMGAVTAQINRTSAQIAYTAGWSLFLTMIIGGGASILGGALASRMNATLPLTSPWRRKRLHARA